MPTSKSLSEITPPSEEWDFSQLPSDEGYLCSVYEHARDVDWFKAAVSIWRGRRGRRDVFVMNNDPASMASYQDALEEANACRPIELRRPPESMTSLAEGAVISFPYFPAQPWQSLNRAEKFRVARVVPHEPSPCLEEGYEQLKVLVKIFEEQGVPLSRWSENAEGLKNDLEVAELFVFHIASGSSRDQVKEAFGRWVDNGMHFPNTHGDRRLGAIRNTPADQLKCLAIKRLMDHSRGICPLSQLIPTAKEQCKEYDWLPLPENRWHDARRKAERFIAKLFPSPRFVSSDPQKMDAS